MPRVTFQPKNEVSAVHTFERVDKDVAKDIFYQEEDYIRFRVEYRMFKAEQKRVSGLNRLSPASRLDRRMASRQREMNMNAFAQPRLQGLSFPQQRQLPRLGNLNGKNGAAAMA